MMVLPLGADYARAKAIPGMQQRSIWQLMAALLLVLSCFGNAAVAGSSVVVGTIDSAGISKLIKANEGAMVIVAMAAWCLPCRQELPTLAKLYNKYKTKGLKMVGISLDLNGPSAMQPLLEKARVKFPVYWAGEKAVRDLNISAIPMLLLARDGKIVEKIPGLRSEKFLDKKISDLLKADR
jgi:thiol-disulfide isomerase/thioredoxin